MHSEQVQVPVLVGGFMPAAAQSKVRTAGAAFSDITGFSWTAVVPSIGLEGVEKSKVGKDDTEATLAVLRAITWREVAIGDVLLTTNAYVGRLSTSTASADSLGSILAFVSFVGWRGGLADVGSG